MCGIAGWVSYSQAIDKNTLLSMRDVLSHRGPDGKNIWLNKGERVGFAHRRLSIIDLSETANQPMSDISGQFTIVFNGEIYNHRQLRQELEQQGIRFKTHHSDTEVLLNGYIAWGIDKLLKKIIGMFAFAIYDGHSHQVTLVRDRVGIKPLYFAKVPDGFVFASELKALLVHPAIRAELNQDTLGSHLTFRSLPSPNTLFKNIESVAPSTVVEFNLDDSNDVKKRLYWDPVTCAAPAPPTLASANERLEELLADSVAMRLESDVPVGLFLSGGLDSALLLQLMSEKLDNVGTYTIGYPGHQAFDESEAAQQLASKANSDHHAIGLSEAQYMDALINVAYHQDEPNSAPVCTSVYYLAKEASDTGRKVVLAGEGADELFFGYKTWQQSRDLQKAYDKFAKVLGPRCLGLPALLAKAQFGHNSKPAEILNRLANGHPLFWGGGLDFGRVAKAELLGTDPANDTTYESTIEPIRQEYLKAGDPEDLTQWMSYVDLRFRLPQLMLPRLDKMGMAHSVEGRVPYLDHRIIEFVFGLPPEWRGQVGRTTKPMLKTVAHKYLPESFITQRKRGFQAPVSEWKTGALGKTYLPMLEAFSAKTSLFDSRAIKKLTNSNNDRLYFSLINFMIWYCIYIDNPIDLNLDSIA